MALGLVSSLNSGSPGAGLLSGLHRLLPHGNEAVLGPQQLPSPSAWWGWGTEGLFIGKAMRTAPMWELKDKVSFSHNGEWSHTGKALLMESSRVPPSPCKWTRPLRFWAHSSMGIGGRWQSHLVLWGCTSPGEEAEDTKAKMMSGSHNLRLMSHGSRVYKLG